MTRRPLRIQRKRTKGWTMPPTVVYVGRPTRWGNPHKVGVSLCAEGRIDCGGNGPLHYMTAADAVAAYRETLAHWLTHYPLRYDLKALRGKDLACWCPLDQPCHADVLLEISNAD